MKIMNNEELLDFYESYKDQIIKLRYYECQNEITLEDLCRLVKIVNKREENEK